MGVAMKSWGLVLLLVAAGWSLAGCSQPRPKPILGCAYQLVPLTVQTPSVPAPMRLQATPDPAAERWGEVLRERRKLRAPMMATEAKRSRPPPADQFLALSGGGQHGAFGAGFFYAMGTLPSWDIVTGVSTGSLQSTLLFLANQPVPDDRTDYSWVDGPLSGPGGDGRFVVRPHVSNVGDLVLAYSIAREADLLRVRKGGAALGTVFRGSAAQFDPLRARLLKIMTIGTLRAVGREWRDQNRQLFVGVSNLDDGEGYAIDMTELAARTLTTDAAGALSRIQGCYVDALLASSSVAPGVPPLTLDTRRGTEMYMDGGARFGVFLEPMLRAFQNAGGGRAQVTLMVNTTMEAPRWSGGEGPRQRWSAADAAARAVKLLETQVYRFSAASVETVGAMNGGLDMAYLGNAGIAGGEAPLDHGFNGKSCAAWLALDAAAKPLQFSPRYMACIADYGRSRGATAQWNRRLAPPY